LVATNATLTSAQARRVAIMAQDGFARALNPIHASGDGDVVFAMSTGRRSLPEPTAASVSLIGTLAADCVARSIGRAVYEAKSLNLTKSYRDQKSV
jgi:L-aminopeptidase/D-esterase-like protein